MTDSLIQDTIPTEMSSGFVKQRRNLLAISIVVPLFLISGATLDQVNVLGNIISIQNGEFTIYSLYVLFVYFVIRYVQYYSQEQRRKTFKSELKKRITASEKIFFTNLVCSRYPKLKKEIELNNASYSVDFVKEEDKKVSLFQKSRKLTVAIDPDTYMVRVSDEVNIEYNVFKIWWINIFEYLKLSIKTSYASDYHLPLWVAITSSCIVLCYKILPLIP